MDRDEALNILMRGGDDPSTRPPSRWWTLLRRSAMLLILVAAGVVGWVVLHPQPVAVHVVDVTVKGGSAPGSTLNASGYVVPQLQATVAAQITGMITAVYAQEGEHVAQGQILARLDDSAAKASVATATSQMEADQALVPQFEAQLVKDQRNLARMTTLSKQGAASQADLDAAVAAVKQDQALVSHARDQAEADRKTMALNQILLSYTVIRAPFAGVVTERYAHPGEMISPEAVGGFTQTGICTLVDMSSLEINVDVNEAYISRIHAGQSADAVLNAYPDWHIPAHVINVVPTANEQKATVKVRLAFDKFDARILPQMSAQVWFRSDDEAHGAPIAASLEIPSGAVRGSPPDLYVYRVADGRIHRVAVRTAPAQNGFVRVLSGLEEGDRIVSRGPSSLSDDEAVHEQ